jgi:L-cystine transport system substrate-binding protein
MLAVTSILALSMLAACSSQTDNKAAGTAGTEGENVTTYVMGTSGAFAPFAYMDEDGVLTGYDVEVMKKVDALLPEVAFDMKTYDSDGLFLGLDGGSIDLITHQYGKNAEREEKYLFAAEPFGFTAISIATRAADTDINNAQGLEGKTAMVTATGLPNAWLTEYNETQATTPVELKYYEGDWVQGMQLIANGEGDAMLAPAVNIDVSIQNMGLPLRRVAEPLYTSDVYFIYNQDNAALRDQIDVVLRELKADGTLKALSEQFLGGDYSGQ